MAFEDIERDFKAHEIKHNGVCVWPIVKSYLIGTENDTKVIKETSLSFVLILLKNLFRDLFGVHRIKKSNYWVFTNSERRYYINRQSFDRTATGLLNYIGGYVLFENPIPKGKTRKKDLNNGEYYVGMSWIFLFQFLIQKFSSRPKIAHLDALESYLKRDLRKIRNIFHRISAGERIYSFLIRRYSPEAIFVVCYYSNFELIKAAKKNRIPVIELQHGLVSKGHRAYYYSRDYGRELLPDYFLSFGPYSSEIVIEGNLLKANRVLNYGYSFLEEVSEKLTISNELRAIKNKYKKIICITGQLPATDIPLLKLVEEVTDFFPDFCFIFKPRFMDSTPTFSKKANFVEWGHINTYELLKYSDYHMTVYSTCAMESIALGTPNISVDIKGYYTKFLKTILQDNPYNYLVTNPKELKDLLSDLEGKSFEREDIKNSIRHIFSRMVSSKAFLEFFNEIIKKKPCH